MKSLAPLAVAVLLLAGCPSGESPGDDAGTGGGGKDSGTTVATDSGVIGGVDGGKADAGGQVGTDAGGQGGTDAGQPGGDGGTTARAPNAPTAVLATGGVAEIVVTWTAPTDPGTSAITSYLVTPSVGTAQTVTSTAATFTGLAPSTTLTFTVAATNAVGTGPASSASSPATTFALPAAPVDLLATPHRSQVALSWSAPSSNGGSEITGYVVTTYLASASVGTMSVTATTATVGSLVNGTSYSFGVAAVTAVGTGPETTITSTPRGAPGAPTGVTAVAGIRSATVSWSASIDNGGDAIASWVVTPYVGSVAQATKTVSGGSTLSTTVSGLTNATTYTFVVAAVNANGTGAASSPSTAVTTYALPGAPTGVTASRDQLEVTVTWVAPSSNGGQPITGFVVVPYEGTVAKPGYSISGGSTTSTVINSGLSTNTQYTFVVSAVTAVGTGPASTASNAITTATVPNAPINLTATWSAKRITLSWDEPPNGGTNIHTFIASIPSQSLSVSMAVNSTSASFAPLAEGQSYVLNVVAINAVGSSTAATLTFFLPCSSCGFPTGSYVQTRGSSAMLVHGDFNGDGFIDFATAGATPTPALAMHSGANNGSFDSAYLTTLPTGTPFGMVLGELSGDALTDLVVASETADHLTVLRGTGTAGGFVIDRTYTLHSIPSGLAIGQLSNDSLHDVAVALTGSNEVAVLQGLPDGGLADPTNYAVGTSPGKVATGDLNGDALTDLVVSNRGSSTVSVLLGTMAGSFTAATNFATSTAPADVKIADLNGDGHQDIITANFMSSSVSVLLGTGNGSFDPQVTYSAGGVAFPQSLALADFNGDGKIDVAVPSTGSHSVAILLNSGSGTLLAPVTYLSGYQPIAVDATDVNGDGKTDLLVLSSVGFVDPLLNRGDGTFIRPASVSTGTNALHIALGRFTNNNRNDALVLTQTQIIVHDGYNNGGFGPTHVTALPIDSVHDSVIADFNADQLPDIVVTNETSSSATVFLGAGDGTFSSMGTLGAGNTPKGAAAADLNGDGKLDLVIALSVGSTTGGAIMVRLGNGDGTFSAAIEYVAAAGAVHVACGDFTGDNKVDVLFATDNQVLQMNGDGLGALGTPSLLMGINTPGDLQVADLNGDGRPDFVLTRMSETRMAVALASPAGGFNPATEITTGSAPRGLAFADMNGDSKTDIVVAVQGTRGMGFNFQEIGGFSGTISYAAGAHPVDVAAGDLNNDGVPDAVVLNPDSNTFSVMLNKCLTLP